MRLEATLPDSRVARVDGAVRAPAGVLKRPPGAPGMLRELLGFYTLSMTTISTHPRTVGFEPERVRGCVVALRFEQNAQRQPLGRDLCVEHLGPSQFRRSDGHAEGSAAASGNGGEGSETVDLDREAALEPAP